MGNLTARAAKSAKPAEQQYSLTDGKVPGLALRVSPGGAKAWTLRYRINGRMRRMTLGRFPRMGLAEAREEAQLKLRQRDLGNDPARAKRDPQDDTVKAVAGLYLDLHALGPDVGPRDKDTGRIKDPWTFEPETGTPRKRTWKEDRRKLDVEIIPKWGARGITEIDRRDVRELVEAIAHRGAPTQANRVRALLSKLFNFALERDMVEANPVLATSRPGEETPRDRVLDDDEIRKLWKATGEFESKQRRALFRLMLLTGQRLGEVRDMRWEEIDLENKMWTIPASRSKNRKPHRVPLTEPVLEILRGLPRLKSDPHVLATARGNRQTYEAADEIGLPDFQVGRDLRSTAATRMASSGVPRLHVGLVLNHSTSDVTGRHYDRASYDREKRQALDALARAIKAVLDKSGSDNVVPISAGQTA